MNSETRRISFCWELCSWCPGVCLIAVPLLFLERSSAFSASSASGCCKPTHVRLLLSSLRTGKHELTKASVQILDGYKKVSGSRRSVCVPGGGASPHGGFQGGGEVKAFVVRAPSKGSVLCCAGYGSKGKRVSVHATCSQACSVACGVSKRRACLEGDAWPRARKRKPDALLRSQARQVRVGRVDPLASVLLIAPRQGQGRRGMGKV